VEVVMNIVNQTKDENPVGFPATAFYAGDIIKRVDVVVHHSGLYRIVTNEGTVVSLKDGTETLISILGKARYVKVKGSLTLESL
jgi:hypothetical protein